MVPPNPSNQPNPNPQGNPQPSYNSPTNPPKKKAYNPFIPIALTVGFLMLVAVAWLTYTSMSTTRALEQKVAEYEEAERLRGELETQYNQAVAELEAMKGDNEQINALIDQQKAELAVQKTRITEMLREKKKLDSALAEIRSLKTKVAEYIAQIETLKAEQEQLSMENTQLQQDRENLSLQLQEKSVENESLSTAKAQLVNEKEQLSKAVEVGSVVKVKEINVTGQKVKKSGKTATKDKSKRVDQLKVCFTTVANDLVKPGTEKFFIRIVNPKGENLAIDDLGSGMLVSNKTGEEITYTQMAEYDYQNDETQLCFLWNPGMPFQSGKYQVEIYNKGLLAGAGNFELK